MSGTLNKVMLIGHLGDGVKMHYFEGGGSIGRFPLATNESYTNKSTGEKVNNTEWHNIVVRNKAAEICEKYLSKGDRIYVEGRIKTRKWTGKVESKHESGRVKMVPTDIRQKSMSTNLPFSPPKKRSRKEHLRLMLLPNQVWRKHLLKMLTIYPFKKKPIGS